MAELSVGNLPNVSVSHDLFSDITADERFPMLPEKELANLRQNPKSEHLLEYKNYLVECFQRVESVA